MATMIIKCRKCGEVLGINENKRKKIKELDCPKCGEECFENWIIIGESKENAPHNIDNIIKKQKQER